MTQEERLDCLLRYLLAEREEYKALAVPPARRSGAGCCARC